MTLKALSIRGRHRRPRPLVIRFALYFFILLTCCHVEAAPTSTISGIDITADTGVSDTDFITRTAQQTITATLSAELDAGEILYGSVDAGTTFIDITDKVTGTAISWDGATLLSGSYSIQLKVTASGVVVEQPYLYYDAGAYVSDVASSMAHYLPEIENNVLNVDFTSNTAIAAGAKVNLSLPGFGTGIVASPDVTSATASFISITYDSAAEVLAITFASSVAANNRLRLVIPIATSPVAGDYVIGVSFLGSPVTLAPPLVFGPRLSDINCSITPDTVGAINTSMALSFKCNQSIASGEKIYISLPGFGAGIVTSPSLTETNVAFSEVSYDTASEVLSLTLGTNVDANFFFSLSLPVAQNPAIGIYNLGYNVGLSYQGWLVTHPLYVNPVYSGSISVNSLIAGGSSTLTVSFSVDAPITVGTTIGVDLPSFGTGIVANPAISLVSGWGSSGYNDVAYDSGNGQLTWTVTTADIPANTLVTVDIPIAANPPAGIYDNMAVIDDGRIMRVSSPLTFMDLISSVSASMSSAMAGASNTTLTVSFSTSAAIVPGTTIGITLAPIDGAAPFGTGISINPTVTAVSGWGPVTLTGAVYSSSSNKLTVAVSGSTGSSVPPNTLVTMTIAVAQNPAFDGSYDVAVSYNGATGQAASPLIIYNPPTFVSSGDGSLTLGKNAPATDITHLLQVSDGDLGQTETWSQSSAPSHGSLTFNNATASSGGSGIISPPYGSITYTPAPGYEGADSFTIQVSDGTSTATRVINVVIAVVVSSMDVNTPGTTNTFLTVSFSSASTIPIGTTVTVSLPGFGAGIVSTPAISLVSGWGPAGFTDVNYNASTGTLTWNVTNFSIAPNTLLTVKIPVAQNPPVGSYNLGVKLSPSSETIPTSPPLTFHHPLRIRIAPGNTQGLFDFTIDGPIDQAVVLESSINLLDWEQVDNLTLTSGTATVSEPDPGDQSRRFYRVRQP